MLALFSMSVIVLLSPILMLTSFGKTLLDSVATPFSALLALSRRAPYRHWLGLTGALTVCLAATVWLPSWLSLITAGLGLSMIIAVFRAWQKNEESRQKVFEGLSKEGPDAGPNLACLNVYAALYIVPLFAFFLMRLNELLGKPSGQFENSVIWSLTNLQAVLTFDVLDALIKAIIHPGDDTRWPFAIATAQKALLAVMFLGAIKAYERTRQVLRASVIVFNDHPDLLVRMGQRGVSALRKCLAQGAPRRDKQKELLMLKDNRAYTLITDELKQGLPPASTTAAWIVRQLEDRSALPFVNARLRQYLTFFEIYTRDLQSRQYYQREILDKNGRPLQFKPGKWEARWQNLPLRNEEVYEERDIDDVCELTRCLTALYVPKPWLKDEMPDLAQLLTCNSPAIRAAAAENCATYSVYGAQASNKPSELAAALEKETAHCAALAQMKALASFGNLPKGAIKSASAWLTTDLMDDHFSLDEEIPRAAARVILSANSIAFAGNQLIGDMLDHPYAFVRQCAIYLLDQSNDDAAVPAAKLHLVNADGDIDLSILQYLLRSAPGLLSLAQSAKTMVYPSDANLILCEVSDAARPEFRSAQLVEELKDVVATHLEPEAREHAVRALERLGATEAADTIVRQLVTELDDLDAGYDVILACVSAVGAFRYSLAGSILLRIANGEFSAPDWHSSDVLREAAKNALARITQ
jgi:hypothetical protein